MPHIMMICGMYSGLIYNYNISKIKVHIFHNDVSDRQISKYRNPILLLRHGAAPHNTKHNK